VVEVELLYPRRTREPGFDSHGEVIVMSMIRPMLATLGALPAPPGWGYEFKWDGVRAVVYVDGGQVHAFSRNDRDVVAGYPELATLAKRFPRRRVVLDGEIVALDAHGRPSFSLLQQRMHVRSPSAELVARIPVRLYVFDLLHLGTDSLLDLPYTRRRGKLAGLALDDDVVETPPWFADEAGADLMGQAAERGLEGVIAKRLDSRYQPGVRSPDWVKAPLNVTTEVVIAGWKPGEGRRAGMIGALVLGKYDDAGKLVFVGGVGTGFTNPMLADLARQLRPLHRATSPFDRPVPRAYARDAQWVEPRLVGEVTYRNQTPDGRLRHPSWRGLRPDREPGEARL
jgi:bifunctional non-homologous end joining protein LigD